MAFYMYSQNNSGGSFDENENVGHYVIVEAENAKAANQKAEDIGIYFDGVADGSDCECCGDRWYRQGSWSDEKGDAEPMVYGKPLNEWLESKDSFIWHDDSVHVYYADGKHVRHVKLLKEAKKTKKSK